MPWWSWAIVVYAGLFGVFTLTITFTCVAIRLSSRLRSRRLVGEAERFLTHAALALGKA